MCTAMSRLCAILQTLGITAQPPQTFGSAEARYEQRFECFRTVENMFVPFEVVREATTVTAGAPYVPTCRRMIQNCFARDVFVMSDLRRIVCSTDYSYIELAALICYALVERGSAAMQTCRQRSILPIPSTRSRTP